MKPFSTMDRSSSLRNRGLPSLRSFSFSRTEAGTWGSFRANITMWAMYSSLRGPSVISVEATMLPSTLSTLFTSGQSSRGVLAAAMKRMGESPAVRTRYASRSRSWADIHCTESMKYTTGVLEESHLRTAAISECILKRTTPFSSESASSVSLRPSRGRACAVWGSTGPTCPASSSNAAGSREQIASAMG